MTSANDNTHLNRAATDKGWFCPACGGASIEASEIGGTASCGICTWKGTTDDLNTYKFTHGHASKEEIFHDFFLGVRALLGKEMSLEFGKLLLKWGFVTLPTNASGNKVFGQTVARYLGSAAQAIARSVVETRAAIEKEEHDAGNTQG